MAVAAIIVVGVGVVLVLAGLFVTIVDWGDKRKKHPGLVSKDTGLEGSITALQKLLAELAKHPLGTRLIVLGIVCFLIGGTLGGVAGLVE